MQEHRLNTVIWPSILVACGSFLLLFNLGLLARYEPIAQYIVAGLLVIGSVGFFITYLSARQNWWYLIPGWTLFALSVMALLSTFSWLDQRINAAFLFVGLAFAFGHIYLLDRSESWWAIIPGGFMSVLGAVMVLSSMVERIEILGMVLFIGMGCVFFLLYLLSDQNQQWWALIPGTVLVLFGLFVLTFNSEGRNRLLYWWPSLVILIGLALGWRAYVRPISYSPAASRVNQNRRKVSSDEVDQSGQERQNQDGSSQDDGPMQLGEYTNPAPGATVEILPDPDES